MKRFAVLFCMLAVCPLLSAQQKRVLAIEPTVVSEELKLPPEWLASFNQNLAELLKYSQKYEKVVGADEKDRPGDAMQLKVNIVGFTKGSRAERYMIGFGAGREKLKAIVSFKDLSSGKTLLEKDFTSTTTMGAFGSKSGETPRKLAEKIVREVVKY